MKKTLFRIFKGILIFLLIVLAIAGGILAYNMWLNQTFVTTFYTVTTDKDIENMRIVELSDLHLREYGEKNADLVERIRNLKPDIIAVAGDMNIDENPDYTVVLELMEQLVEIAPVYYGPGNYEWAGIYGWHYSAMADDIGATSCASAAFLSGRGSSLNGPIRRRSSMRWMPKSRIPPMCTPF